MNTTNGDCLSSKIPFLSMMQMLVSSGSTVRFATVFDRVIENVKHSVLSVKLSVLIGMDTHWSVSSSLIVTSPEVAV